jgi:polysaccharide pyruvyl transferase WcaK-like protein
VKAFAYVAELALAALLVPATKLLKLVGWQPRHVTIVGWWGSETVGDVAILGQLLAELRETAPTVPVRVISFDAQITRTSLRELQRSDIPVYALGPSSAWGLVSSRCVVVGGGPLMESPSMRPWAWRHRVARAAGANVLLYANGIGPVRSPAGVDAIASIVRGASHVVLRDVGSVQWCAQHAQRSDVTLSFDPAFDFVHAHRTAGVLRRPQLALALRTPPAAYLGASDTAAATERFLDRLAASLNALVKTHDVQFAGIVMHEGFTDSDDAALYERLRAKLTEPARLHVAPAQKVSDVIRTLQESHGALTVRFHAMIFALATDTPFVAVDSARPDGKVSAAADDIGRAAHVVTWDALNSDDLSKRLGELLSTTAAAPIDVRARSAARRAVLRAALS